MEISITASLSGWEKVLLHNFQQVFPKDVAASNTQTTIDLDGIFNGWCWARKLREDIEEVFGNAVPSPGSDSPTKWELIRRWIAHCDDRSVRHSRLSQLLQDNKDLEKQLVNTKLPPNIDANLSIIPHTNDQTFWAIVVDAMYCLPCRWRGLALDESVSDRFGHYNLVSDVNMEKAERAIDGLLSVLIIDDKTHRSPSPEGEPSAPASCHQPQLATHSRSDTKMFMERVKNKLVIDDEAPNAEMALERLMKCLSAPAPRHHDKERPPETESSTGETRSTADSNYDGLTSGYREYAIWSLTRMAGMERRRQLRKAKLGENLKPALGLILPFSLDDPTRWLEYIPIHEMTGSSKISPGIELLWRTPEELLLDHHLFTEEEVFKYCVETKFAFPGYKKEDSIVFVASELNKSPVLGELDKLQDLWNDCAVTCDPTDGQWYLLETNPGLEFRRITAEFGINAARGNFRKIVDETRLNRISRLKDIFQDTCNSGDLSQFAKYDSVVEAIDFTEIILCEKKPLGGRNGDVFRATWSCPHKVNMSSPKTLNVALKRIWPPRSESAESRSEARLFRELDLTLQVSARQPSGLCVLYGLTRAPFQHLSEIAAPRKETIQDSIFLVFEFAQQSLEEYFRQTLRGEDKDWDVIAHRFEDLAYSIGTIHGQKIVHRDIHLGNVMIREETYFKSPTVLSGGQLVIIDFGESRALETISESYNLYGDDDFWAPEVKSGCDMSMESDMYAVGRIMIEVLKMRCEISNDLFVPQPLLDAAAACLREKTERLTARKLSEKLYTINSDNFRLDAGGVNFPRSEFVKLAVAESSHPAGSDDEDESDSIFE